MTHSRMDAICKHCGEVYGQHSMDSGYCTKLPGILPPEEEWGGTSFEEVEK